MSKFVYFCGIIFSGIGFALGVLGVASPSQLAIYGLTAETAAILLVGGVLCMGLASMIDAIANRFTVGTASSVPDLPVQRHQHPADESIFKRRNNDMVSGIGKVGAAAGASVISDVVANDKTAPSVSVAETIEALEQAKSDIKAALGEAPTAAAENFDPLPVKLQSPEPAPQSDQEQPESLEPETDGPEATDSGEPELYVVEEQVVRGKPARILSDGTVEAETDDGWMRFENMEHLNEYLDSVSAS